MLKHLMKEQLRDLLDVKICVNPSTGKMSESDVSKLVQSHFLIQKARDEFLDGYLTFGEYLDLCEEHQLNMDAYLEVVEENLEIIRAL